MRKIARTIAIILVLVILASSFTSCLSYWGKGHSTGRRILYAVVDILTLPISLICLLIYIIITQEAAETQDYLANMDDDALIEYYALYEKMNSLPESEIASLQQMLQSIPQAELNAAMAKCTSLSGAQLTSMVSAYNLLSKGDIIASIERIEALSGTELVSLLQEFNGLTEEEINSLIESITGEMGNAALVQTNKSLPELVSENELAMAY